MRSAAKPCRIMMENSRTYVEIHTAYIRENVIHLKQKLSPKTKFMAVVKGNAYGHGIEPCVHAIDDLCDWYATATMQEAIRVRAVSREKPILVFGYVSDEEIKQAASYAITLSAVSTAFLQHISAICVQQRLQVAVHLKLDTGFHRLGISCCENSSECMEELLPLYALPNIHITGIYTHLVFAGSVQEQEQAFTQLQYQRFKNCIAALRKLGVDPGICHICNSKAAVHHPQLHMDMVRVGAYMFGLASAQEQELIPLKEALLWKARVVLLREIKAGEGVGYGHDFIAEKATRIAVLAAGFADGYRRCIAQSPQSYVLLHGKRAPLVGKVCMDMFMVDVTAIQGLHTGEYAVLCGQADRDAVSSYLLGKIIQGTAGEITVGITERVKRHIL